MARVSPSIRRRTRGFTVVEIVVVVVAIAVLATITVVAYDGIQSNAYSSKAVSATNSYIKILETYRAKHRTYPATTDGESICLGSTADYPADDGMDAGACTNYGLNVDENFNNTLRPYVNRVPNGALPTIDLPFWGATLNIRGMLYYSYDGTTAAISYAVDGNEACAIGNKDEGPSEVNITMCVINLPMKNGGTAD